MNFESQLGADILRVFLNDKEFAKMHEISDGNDAINCLMIINSAATAGLLSGVELRARHISAILETENLPENHAFGCTIYLDGVAYSVENEPIDAHGMTELLLKRLY